MHLPIYLPINLTEIGRDKPGIWNGGSIESCLSIAGVSALSIAGVSSL